MAAECRLCVVNMIWSIQCILSVSHHKTLGSWDHYAHSDCLQITENTCTLFSVSYTLNGVKKKMFLSSSFFNQSWKNISEVESCSNAIFIDVHYSSNFRTESTIAFVYFIPYFMNKETVWWSAGTELPILIATSLLYNNILSSVPHSHDTRYLFQTMISILECVTSRDTQWQWKDGFHLYQSQT